MLFFQRHSVRYWRCRQASTRWIGSLWPLFALLPCSEVKVRKGWDVRCTLKGTGCTGIGTMEWRSHPGCGKINDEGTLNRDGTASQSDWSSLSHRQPPNTGLAPSSPSSAIHPSSHPSYQCLFRKHSSDCSAIINHFFCLCRALPEARLDPEAEPERSVLAVRVVVWSPPSTPHPQLVLSPAVVVLYSSAA